MKKIACVLSVMALSMILGISGGMSPSIAESAEAKIKPCEVSIPVIENIFLGKESVSFAPHFEISNPNDFPVTTTDLRYEIYLKDFLCDGRNLPLDYYIPAKGKITVTGAFAITWVNMAMWIWQTRGVTMAAATKEIVPVWKNLNGLLFNPKMKELWDQVPSEHLVFNAKGEVDIVGPGGQTMTCDYSTSWKMSDEYALYR